MVYNGRGVSFLVNSQLYNLTIMRKITLTIVLSITALLAFSQIKHNKFSTGIKFAQFNPGFEFWHTIPTEIGGQNGYFLSNHYDDQAYGVHPSLVKLDFEGNIVFDSIYEFTPLNLSGYTYVKSATTNSSSHTVLYQTGSMSTINAVCPYVVNYDLNGNINWHTGFTDDTLDIESHKIINTQDGGYLVVGSMYDWYSGIQKPSGVLVKLDNAGTLMWHKLYTNKDTMDVKFSEGIETPTGGLLLVGSTDNFSGGMKQLGQWDKLVTLVRTDDQGNMIWNKGITLDNPIDNSYGFGDISIGMINLTEAFISYGAYDSTGVGTGKFAVSVINVNTGVVNWTKVFSLPPSQEVSIRKTVADFKGNIIVSASDYNNSTGVLFHLNNQGGVLGSSRFISSPISAHFPYETINTKDGGFLHVSEVDQNDVLVVKTDGNLDPACPNIDSVYAHTLLGAINVDTSYIGFIDTTFTLPIFNSVQMTSGSPFNTVSDDSLICSCSNTVQGTVTEAGVTPVNNAKVFLFRKGMVPHPWNPIDSTTTDAAGNYQFNYVPTDSFIVRVEPDTILFPGAMTSYFKEPQWCYRWDLAGVFSVHCDSGIVQKDVKLVVPPALTGNSTVGGYVFESSGSFQKNQQPGDPIPGIDITVDQSPGGIAGGSTSGPGGHYSLSGLDTNATYIITIDFPGLPHDSVWTININLNDTTLDSLNFYIDSTGIYILEDSFGVGVDVFQTDNIDVDLYPNPNNGIFTVKINAIKPEEVEMQLIDKVGKTITTRKQRMLEGDNKVMFDETESLPAGVYFLKIREGNNMHIKKIVKL